MPALYAGRSARSALPPRVSEPMDQPDDFATVLDLPARVRAALRHLADMNGDGAAAIQDLKGFFVGLARADIDRQRAPQAGEQAQRGPPQVRAFGNGFQAIGTL